MSNPQRPNPPGHRPYSTRAPVIPPQPTNASIGLAKNATARGYTSIDHGWGGDHPVSGVNAQGQRVNFINGKTPEQVQEEQAVREQQSVTAQNAPVHNPQFDQNGALIGGISKTDGQKMTVQGGKLVGDGKPNPQFLQKLTQPTDTPPPANGPATAPAAPPQIPQVIAGTPAAAATAIKTVAGADAHDPLGTAYGSSMIIHDAPPAIPISTQLPDGSTRIAVGQGGSVNIPATQPQTAPANGGTGIYVNGVPQTQAADDRFVADMSGAGHPAVPPTVPTTPAPAPTQPAQVPASKPQQFPDAPPTYAGQTTGNVPAIASAGFNPNGHNFTNPERPELFSPRLPSETPSPVAPAPLYGPAPTLADAPHPDLNKPIGLDLGTGFTSSAPPKVGEIPSSVSHPAGMLGATTPSIPGFGDTRPTTATGVAGFDTSKPPGIPGAGIGSLAKPVGLSLGTGTMAAPTIPAPKLDDDEERKRLASATP